MERNEDGTLGPEHITDEGIELNGGTMTMTLREALEALHERIGNDPDCNCDDCTKDREIVAQLASLPAEETSQ